MKIRFAKKGDFAAFAAAAEALSAAGFSIGSTQRDAPVGIMHGKCFISKWRNLTGDQISRLHGSVVGDLRNGPVYVRLNPTAPEAVKNAFDQIRITQRVQHDSGPVAT